MSDGGDPRAERDVRQAKGVFVVAILGVILVAVVQTVPWFTPQASLDAFSEMTHLLFEDYIVPFEVLGFLLLAALIGALFLASREATRRA